MKITNKHSYTFPDTGESVTAYVSNCNDGLAFAISFRHDETVDTLHWTKHYEGMLQLQSKINPLIWYIYLSGYWDGGTKGIPIERVMMVKDCKCKT